MFALSSPSSSPFAPCSIDELVRLFEALSVHSKSGREELDDADGHHFKHPTKQENTSRVPFRTKRTRTELADDDGVDHPSKRCKTALVHVHNKRGRIELDGDEDVIRPFKRGKNDLFHVPRKRVHDKLDDDDDEGVCRSSKRGKTSNKGPVQALFHVVIKESEAVRKTRTMRWNTMCDAAYPTLSLHAPRVVITFLVTEADRRAIARWNAMCGSEKSMHASTEEDEPEFLALAPATKSENAKGKEKEVLLDLSVSSPTPVAPASSLSDPVPSSITKERATVLGDVTNTVTTDEGITSVRARAGRVMGTKSARFGSENKPRSGGSRGGLNSPCCLIARPGECAAVDQPLYKHCSITSLLVEMLGVDILVWTLLKVCYAVLSVLYFPAVDHCLYFERLGLRSLHPDTPFFSLLSSVLAPSIVGSSLPATHCLFSAPEAHYRPPTLLVPASSLKILPPSPRTTVFTANDSKPTVIIRKPTLVLDHYPAGGQLSLLQAHTTIAIFPINLTDRGPIDDEPRFGYIDTNSTHPDFIPTLTDR
ncbi:hypothetical protein B0H10DRAFT_2219501 [Mycena sp. CBHHK59/15]|nr:hypothetical protein B0H10DRAFT_2219501 [Mycena sp. CBHHK59/15]